MSDIKTGHFYYFSTATIRRLLESLGFKVELVGTKVRKDLLELEHQYQRIADADYERIRGDIENLEKQGKGEKLTVIARKPVL